VKASLKGIYFDYFFPAEGRRGRATLLLLPGFPSYPNDQPFAQWLSKALGTAVLYPRYPGSWESRGRFFDMKAFLSFVKALPGARVEDLYTGKRAVLPKTIYSLGHSFGGFLTAHLVKEGIAKRGVAIAPPFNFPLGELARHILWVRRAFGEAYRLSSFYIPRWEGPLPEGLMVFHSVDDEVVTVEQNRPLYRGLLGKRVFLVKGYGHGNKSKLIKRHFKKVKAWFS